MMAVIRFLLLISLILMQGGAIFGFTDIHNGISNLTVVSEEKLIIDHDGGADDAMAIFMAVLYEKYFNGPNLIGLSTTHGNVNEDQAFENTQKILSVFRKTDVPIYRGSNSSLVTNVDFDCYFGCDGLGENVMQFQPLKAAPQHAAIALIEMSKKFEDNLTVVALGPLTNIALAVSLDPNFIGRLKHLYIGAGHINDPNDFPDAEFNAQNDAEAYHIVARNARPDKVTTVPFSQCYLHLNITKEWRTDVLGAIPSDTIKALNIFERISLVHDESWILLDPVVMALTLQSNIVTEFKYSDNSIILYGEQRGVNTNNFTTSNEANIRLTYSFDKNVYKELLMDIFTAELDKTVNI